MTIARLKELAEQDSPEKWEACSFEEDGYVCPEYMAAALNALPAMLKIAEMAQATIDDYGKAEDERFDELRWDAFKGVGNLKAALAELEKS